VGLIAVTPFLKASFKQYCSICRCSVIQQYTSYCFYQSGLLHLFIYVYYILLLYLFFYILCCEYSRAFIWNTFLV